ncbi:MAG: hypothetical protein HKN72_01610 [Gemmatimonadetes bacterium]|nr:hypothetical protein [Gemmatimonadota bacterium]
MKFLVDALPGLLATVSIVVLSGCGDATGPPLPTMPFDPTGSWEADVAGSLEGSQVTETMVISIADTSYCAACGGGLAELLGTWEWAGLSGFVDGFWTPAADETARDSGGRCPASFMACSVTLSLRAPDPSCYELLNPGVNSIEVLGWFDGSASLVAASLEGTYWEGRFDDPQPCPGPVLISLDTSASFTRR